MSDNRVKDAANYSIRRVDGLRLRRWGWRVYARGAPLPFEGRAFTSRGAKRAAKRAAALVAAKGAAAYRRRRMTGWVGLAAAVLVLAGLVAVKPALFEWAAAKATEVAVGGMDRAGGTVLSVTDLIPKPKHKKKGHKAKG